MIKSGKYQNIFTVIILTIVLFGFFALNILLPDPEVLSSERRQPAKLSSLSISNILSGSFMSGFEDWASDNFVFRDAFRTVRASTVLGAMMQTDKSGIYLDSAVGAGSFKTIDEASVLKTVQKLRTLAESLDFTNMYFAVIPTKDYYSNRDYPGTDFASVRNLAEAGFPEATHIDVSGALNSGSYYKTDLHWDQSKLVPVAEALGSVMDFSPETGFTKNTAGQFDGVYTGQLALPISQDTAVYLTSDAINNAIVSFVSTATTQWTDGEMYDLEAFGGRDPYDMFLGGTQPLVTIENPDAADERELFIFRDSFGSSLAPLLTSSYSKITLIDLRYIDARILDMFVGFTEECDVLFLYSTEILGTPEILLTGS